MNKKSLRISLLSAAMSFVLSCCGAPMQSAGIAENEILTMKPVDRSKTLITVSYEYGSADVFDLESLLEQKFPRADIVMLHEGAPNSAYSLRQNLLNNVECDIILTRSAPLIKDISPDYLLDLSGQSFTSNYYPSSLDSCMTEDGRLYYLPGPSDIYGVVYNRTMFEENGWKVPQSYTEFVSLIDTINKSGLKAVEEHNGVRTDVNVRALQISLKYPDAFQIVMNTYAYDKVFRGAENQRWLMNYQKGSENMTGHMEPAADIINRLYKDGIISWGDWDVLPSQRSKMMYQYHSAAMIFENLNAYVYNREYSAEDNKDEVGIFPFWTSDEPGGDYLYAIPSYYYALNKASAEESPKKKRLMLEIMEYLSSHEMQEEIVRGDLQFSNVSGVTRENSDFSREIQRTVNEGRIINTFFFLGIADDRVVEKELLDKLPDFLSRRINSEKWLGCADRVRDEYLNGVNKEEVYGTSESTLTKLETAQLVGDMYRHETGAPIALVFAGHDSEGVNGRIYKGDITEHSLECISAASTYDKDTARIAVSNMTGRQIMDFLSGRMGINPLQPEERIIPSGLKIELAPWAEAGSRLVNCKLPDGSELDPDEKYCVAYFYGSLRSMRNGVVKPEKFDNEIIFNGSWEEHFISWLEDIGGEIHAPELDTRLIWNK